MLRGSTGFISLLLGAVWGWCSEIPHARAYNEQASLDWSLGYAALLAQDDLPSHSSTITAGASLGLTDWLVARTAFGYSAWLERARTQHVGRGQLEFVYAIDVVRWVPMLGAGAGLWALHERDRGFVLRPAGHVVLGVDYLLSRTWTLGFDLRGGGLLQPGDVAFWCEGHARISRMFELF